MFISSEHAKIFRIVASIYKSAKNVYSITGPILVIFARVEIKVKARVAWEQKWDTLSGFCGLKENHLCITNYKRVVGSKKAKYEKVFFKMIKREALHKF